MNQTVRTFLATVLLACIISAPGTTQEKQLLKHKIEKAQADLKTARNTLDKTREQLEAVYLKLEKQFDRISGSYCIQFLRALSAAWAKELPGIEEKWKKIAEGSRHTSRRSLDDMAGPILEKAGSKSLNLDPQLLRPFVSKTTNLLYDRFKQGGSVDAEDIEADLLDFHSPDIQFHIFWNEQLFMKTDEARAFEKANEDFAEANINLDRIEHPEKYSVKGEIAPPRMVYIPGGNYLVGPNTGMEKSRRRINLREFYIDKYEITNKEYRDFLNSLTPELSEEYVPHFWPLNRNMEHTYPEDRADHPVTGVSWKAALVYTAWCGKRLPTEEEWEVAARGKKRLAYPWGNSFDPERLNGLESGINQTSEVGAFAAGASPFGCMDMAGNAWEWTSTNQDGIVMSEPDERVLNMVIRGGDFSEALDHTRSDFRWMTPMDPYSGRRPSDKNIGFRCVKKVD